MVDTGCSLWIRLIIIRIYLFDKFFISGQILAIYFFGSPIQLKFIWINNVFWISGRHSPFRIIIFLRNKVCAVTCPLPVSIKLIAVIPRTGCIQCNSRQSSVSGPLSRKRHNRWTFYFQWQELNGQRHPFTDFQYAFIVCSSFQWHFGYRHIHIKGRFRNNGHRSVLQHQQIIIISYQKVASSHQLTTFNVCHIGYFIDSRQGSECHTNTLVIFGIVIVISVIRSNLVQQKLHAVVLAIIPGHEILIRSNLERCRRIWPKFAFIGYILRCTVNILIQEFFAREYRVKKSHLVNIFFDIQIITARLQPDGYTTNHRQK